MATVGRGAEQYTVRFPEGLRDRIKAAAEVNGRSMNAEIVSALEEKYPDPVTDLELTTLASWLNYVQFGGPDEEFDDRLFEINARLDKHPATRHLRLGILVEGEGEEMEVRLVLTGKRPGED